MEVFEEVRTRFLDISACISRMCVFAEVLSYYFLKDVIIVDLPFFLLLEMMVTFCNL